MWWLKGCPRCRGDLYFVEQEGTRTWAACLLCGDQVIVRGKGSGRDGVAPEATVLAKAQAA